MTGALTPVGTGPVVRPATTVKKKLTSFALDHLEPLLGLMRAFLPILVVRGKALIWRFDDVREIFLQDPAFGVPYKRKADVILGGRPFFLTMDDTPAYRAGLGAMREMVPASDVAARIVPAVEARARTMLAQSNGRIDVVDYIRTVTFDVLLDYFGLPKAQNGDVVSWATRIFEFQFMDQDDEPALDAEIALVCPAMIAHAQAAIDARRAGGAAKDDMLGRCLARRAAGDERYNDDAIVCGLIGFIGGGVPQLPMAGPQILDQILRRPDALASAARAARANDDAALLAHVLEGLRFDAMAKFLERVALKDYVLAAGTRRAKTIAAGTPVLLSPASAMMDRRRIANPRRFDATRTQDAYMHFGLGHHQCFGLAINRGVLPAVLKPLLCAKNLRREASPSGRLRKQGMFPDTFVVRFDAP